MIQSIALSRASLTQATVQALGEVCVVNLAGAQHLQVSYDTRHFQVSSQLNPDQTVVLGFGKDFADTEQIFLSLDDATVKR